MLDARNGWALTANSPRQILFTTNGAASWHLCTPPGLADGDEIAEVSFFDFRRAWVFLRSPTLTNCLVLTTDAGNSWSRITVPFYISDGANLHFTTPQAGTVSETDGGLGSSETRFFETADGGWHWRPVLSEEPILDGTLGTGTIHLCTLCGERAGYYPPAKIIITRGDWADEQPKDAVRLSISTNLGKTWRDLSLRLPAEKFNEGLVDCDPPVFFNAQNGCLPVRLTREKDERAAAFNILAFYMTHDGGATWVPSPSPVVGDGDFYGEDRQVDVVSSRDIFVRAGHDLRVTHDGAKTWQSLKSNLDFGPATADRAVVQIDFADATHGWTITSDNFNQSPEGNYFLHKTVDGGVTWIQLPLLLDD